MLQDNIAGGQMRDKEPRNIIGEWGRGLPSLVILIGCSKADDGCESLEVRTGRTPKLRSYSQLC